MLEEKLKGRKIAVVAMGKSQLDYHLSISHSQEYDEVWAIGSMCAVVKADRAFIMDPATRFFETFDAGPQTQVMRKTLPRLDIPIYSCVADHRVPGINIYPLKEVIKATGCSYFNNSIAYALAFALYQEVGEINIFGADFTYKTNAHFAEMGRSCCEFWLAKCMDKNIEVSIALRSNLLDANIGVKEKLYGYHRLSDPTISYLDKNEMNVCKWSEVIQQNAVPVGIIGRDDSPEVWLDKNSIPSSSLNGAPEPNKF